MQHDRCFIPGCKRLTAPLMDKDFALFHCRYHVQHKARHGSHWQKTYKAADLKPYIKAAEKWGDANLRDRHYSVAWRQIDHVLAGAGLVDPAMNLRGQSADYKAKVAFARLREAGVLHRRIVHIYLGVAALIEDDFGSHRTQEFRIVQAAKAIHRLASGTHRKWDVWNPRTGGTFPYELHAYPSSSGHVLRKIGRVLEDACSDLLRSAVPEIVALKVKLYGEHPSHMPPPERGGITPDSVRL